MSLWAGSGGLYMPDVEQNFQVVTYNTICNGRKYLVIKCSTRNSLQFGLEIYYP